MFLADAKYSIRLYNDRKKEMLVIQDKNVEQVLSFISSMKNSDQDYCITNQETLEKFQAKELNKIL